MNIERIEILLKSIMGNISGIDTNDREYLSLKELWQELATSKNSLDLKWYKDAYNYWEDAKNCPISDDGVLGGYGEITPIDVDGSNKFLDKLKKENSSFQFNEVADCGAGIGRVSKYLLLPRFNRVTLIEQSPRLLQASSKYIGDVDFKRVLLLQIGLQDFIPDPNSYDCIWIQWVIGHLTDIDFISFFKRCALGLRQGGYIILKDNCLTQDYSFVIDRDDSSVARNIHYLRLLIDLAGCRIVKESLQEGFPEELYPVYMFAIRPKTA